MHIRPATPADAPTIAAFNAAMALETEHKRLDPDKLRAGVDAAAIERIYMGNVLSAGVGQAPARQAAIGAGLGEHVEATTLNKVCGSGMQAAILGAEALGAGSIDLLVAGGMESMTNAPYLSKAHRGGARFGHDRLFDHMALDGLEVLDLSRCGLTGPEVNELIEAPVGRLLGLRRLRLIGSWIESRRQHGRLYGRFGGVVEIS